MDSAEIETDEAAVAGYEEPGRFGDRAYHRRRHSPPETVRASTDTQSVIGRIKALFRV